MIRPTRIPKKKKKRTKKGKKKKLLNGDVAPLPVDLTGMMEIVLREGIG